MSRIRLALLYGGRSSEHQVSCVSAGCVLRALDPARYEVIPVGITPTGSWVLGQGDPAALEPAAGALPSVEGGASATLSADPTIRALLLGGDPGGGGAPSLRGIDVVFPLLHGPYGEDGTVQGLLELAGVPYVGSGVFASAAAMDKHHMKALLGAAGLPVPHHVVLRPGQKTSEVGDAVAALGWPVFVKPARGGSSIGISRVDGPDDLAAAVRTARETDPKVIVEAAVVGREIECGVLEGLNGAPEASPPAEIHLAAGTAFYDFEAKYLSQDTRFDVPADLPAGVVREVQRLSVRAFEALDCAGLARVDFFLRPDGGLVVNEVNTMPGFTPVSLFPRMWAAAGVDYAALLDRLVTLALRAGTGLR